MSEINIIDSGQIRSDNPGTILGTADRANAGAEMALKNVKLVINTAGNVDTTPIIGSYLVSDTQTVTIENDQIVINGILNLDDATDQALLYPISQLPKTRGYKFLYYDSTSTDANKQMIHLMANTHAFTTTEQSTYSVSAYDHIHVRFQTFNITQSASTKAGYIVKYVLKGVVIRQRVAK